MTCRLMESVLALHVRAFKSVPFYLSGMIFHPLPPTLYAPLVVSLSVS